MCNFISWIEKDGQLLYLTDEDIFSKYGSEMLNDCKDNDFLGHGAIRRFWSKDNKDLEGGISHQVMDFWNTNKLPLELAEKINNFDRYWSKTFSTYFTDNNLRYIICNAPEAWKEKACEELLRRNSLKDNLHYVLCHGPKTLKLKICKILLEQNPTKDDLFCILYYGSIELKEKVCEQLLTQNITGEDLCYILYYIPDSYKEKMWDHFLKQKPTKEDINYVLCHMILKPDHI